MIVPVLIVQLTLSYVRQDRLSIPQSSYHI